MIQWFIQIYYKLIVKQVTQAYITLDFSFQIKSISLFKTNLWVFLLFLFH